MATAGSIDYLQQFVEDTSMFNSIVLSNLLPATWWAPLPHFLQTWLRNYIAGTILYFLSGFLWSFYIYHLYRNVYIPKGRILIADAIPSNKAMLMQIYVAMKAMPWYTLLPTVSEHLIENGWTKCYSGIDEVGWILYFCYLAIYLIFVEFGIYWMHRELHDIKPLYKLLHATHHIYNKQNTLSPFAGQSVLHTTYRQIRDSTILYVANELIQILIRIPNWLLLLLLPALFVYFSGLAFHPVDGILQALPHALALFVIPTHFRTHIALLFLEAVWTANIHDCIHGKLWPVMGAGYHTIHHTTYRHNYGHYTIWMDWMLGTLCEPEEEKYEKVN
ncbi:unnamed protein product [Linum tenue]|uniref:Fatty acid hydroxylase domain-containing protein n=1 Tax=Linum tenue TaxID=586396 RepID=A0AAV0MXE2_9ROSI|nr:unnamed protein product [Linum tenue]